MNELNFLDSLINDFFGDAPVANVVYNPANAPRVDVKEAKDSYTLEMDLPGKSEKDVNIELDRNKLTISSKNEEEKKDKDTKWILKERRPNNFERRFTLPEDVDGENITASFKNGVLTINMQKKMIAAPKKIMIEAAC